ncbi:hypothetical protein AB0K09_24785 [Streptomyces sp. NPDC049577]|uniref:hypothetical protein n=1 Tax=Streptomyces sp. NPDC049577 TaxID=3155153 RepID=UPI00341C78F6
MGHLQPQIASDRDPRTLARYLLNAMYGLRVLGKTADRSAMSGIVDTVLNSL